MRIGAAARVDFRTGDPTGRRKRSPDFGGTLPSIRSASDRWISSVTPSILRFSPAASASAVSALLAASQAQVPIWEYAPAEIKRAVVGYGRAEKSQVQQMVKVLLALFVRTWVFQAFKIPTGSMEHNLLIGDHLIVNKMIFGQTLGRAVELIAKGRIMPRVLSASP